MKLRQNNIEKLDDRVFDVLILGGGINGAVSASALSSQGAQVALIDRQDFASFTSQESSNLVWGGIKYLETMELGLVRKLCVARNHLLKSYPANIKEIRFFTSIGKGFRFPPIFIYFGTLFYWLIGNFFTRPPRFMTRRRINKDEPVVNTDDSAGGFEYSDAYLVDNDARFVFKFVRAALDHGAIVANYVESLGSHREGAIWTTNARDNLTGRRFKIRSRVLINSCGPYVDEQNGLSKQKTEHSHLFSKGIHLIVPRVTEQHHVLTFFADDGRLFFVIPMGTRSCIGTTDTRVEELPAIVTEEDRTFVLYNVNKRLRLKNPLTEADIISERCGVRPLVVEAKPPTGRQKDKGDWTSLSRKHAIDVDYKRAHISIFGGKLTDCVNVGDEIAGFVRELGIRLPHTKVRWYGEPRGETREEYFHQARLMDVDALTEPGAAEPISERLWRRYGGRALGLLEDIRRDPAMAEVMIVGTEYLRCELYHAAKHEMVTKLEDFLRRRSKILLVARDQTIRSAPGIKEACEILFGKQAKAKFDEHFKRNGSTKNSGDRVARGTKAGVAARKKRKGLSPRKKRSKG